MFSREAMPLFHSYLFYLQGDASIVRTLQNNFRFCTVCFKCTRIYLMFFGCTTFTSLLFDMFHFNTRLEAFTSIFQASLYAQVILQGFS